RGSPKASGRDTRRRCGGENGRGAPSGRPRPVRQTDRAGAARWENPPGAPGPGTPGRHRSARFTTRLPAPGPSVIVAHAQVPERGLRTAVPLRHVRVPHELEVLHPHLRGPEPGGGQVPEAVEEGEAVAHLGPGAARPRDVVEHRAALGVVARDEILPEPLPALVVQPG